MIDRLLERLGIVAKAAPSFLDAPKSPLDDMDWYWQFVRPKIQAMPAEMQPYACTMAKHYARRHVNQELLRANTLQSVTNALENMQREGKELTAQIGRTVSAMVPPPPQTPQRIAERVRDCFLDLTANQDAHGKFSTFLRIQDELDPIGLELQTKVRAAQ